MIEGIGELVAGVVKARSERAASKVEAPSAKVQIPPELLRSAPRDVVLTASGRVAVALALAMVAGGIGLGVWLSIQSRREADLSRRIAANALLVQGEITGLDREHGEDPRWRVTYRYAVGARTYIAYARFRVQRAPDLHVGFPVEVAYFASRPEESWLVRYRSEGMPVWVPLVIPLSLLVAPLAIGCQVRRQRRLLEEGRPAIARVTAVKRVRHQHKNAYGVSFEFRDLSGALRTGRFERAQKPPAVGSDIVVLYNAEERKRIQRYPMSLVRVRVPL